MNISLEEFINYNQSELDQIDPSFRESIFTQYPDLSQLENTESKSFSQKLQEKLNLKQISSPKTTISIPEIIKDLKGHHSNSQGSAGIKIGQNGFSLTRRNSRVRENYESLLAKTEQNKAKGNAPVLKNQVYNYVQDESLISDDEKKSTFDYKPKPHVLESDNTNIQGYAQQANLKKQLEYYEKAEAEKEKYRNNHNIKDEESKIFDIDKVDMTSLKHLSREDVKLIQKELLDKKYLQSEDKHVDKKNEDEVIKLQQLLIFKGYDIGKYGKNKDGVDGILGIKTSTALNHYNKNKEIDGKVGPKTIKAFRDYKLNKTTSRSIEYKNDIQGNDEITIQKNLQNKGYFQAKDSDFDYNTDNISLKKEDSKFKLNTHDKSTITECTRYVGEQIENKIKTSGRENIGAYGDAWTIRDNLVRSGAQTIYNVFPKKKDTVTNPEQYLNKITNRTISLSEKDLKSGDIVNLYYGESPNVNKAYKEGSSVWSSHLGIIKEDINGKLFVEHNAGGKIYKEPIENLLNNTATTGLNKPLRITAITRPQYNLKDGEVYEPTQTEINFDVVTNVHTPFGKRESAEYTQILLNNRELLKKDIPVTDVEFNNLVKVARVLSWKESGMQPNPKPSAANAYSNFREFRGGREGSKGYTQLKDEEILESSIRKNLNINNETLLDHRKSAIATMYALSTKYLKIKESLSSDIKMTEDELAQLAMISWNEPVDLVIKTANKYKSLDKVIKAYQDSYGYDEKNETKFPYNLALIAFNNYIK